MVKLAYVSSQATDITGLELESRIFESLFQRRMLKAPLSDFCIVNAAADVLDG